MERKEFETIFNKAKVFMEKKNFKISDQKLKGVLAAKEKGYPILLVGPTGCGKTLLLSLLAEFWEGVYDYESLNGSVTIHDLTQERILDSDGSFIEHDMILAKWLRNAKDKISILHLDEINAARPETLLALHPIMDLKGELVLPYTDEHLKVTKNAVLVMSANEGDEYQGINAMNHAFQNRYIKIHLPYIQGEDLTQILHIKTNVSLENAKAVVTTWEKYMASREMEQPVVSIRVLERWCDLSHLLGLREAGVITFASLIATNEDELDEVIQGDFFINLPNN